MSKRQKRDPSEYAEDQMALLAAIEAALAEDPSNRRGLNGLRVLIAVRKTISRRAGSGNARQTKLDLAVAKAERRIWKRGDGKRIAIECAVTEAAVSKARKKFLNRARSVKPAF
jgi:hypothetical protein